MYTIWNYVRPSTYWEFNPPIREVENLMRGSFNGRQFLSISSNNEVFHASIHSSNRFSELQYTFIVRVTAQYSKDISMINQYLQRPWRPNVMYMT